MEEVDKLVECEADMIALDCTNRQRIDGKTVAELVYAIRTKYPKQLFMADISTLEEGISAAKAGIHFIGTTLNGYTSYTAADTQNAPNYVLVRELVEHCQVPIIAEGHIIYPWQAKEMIELGAYGVVVGGAITRPLEIARRFVNEIG